MKIRFILLQALGNFEEDLYDLHFTAEIPALTNPQKQKLYQESVSILFEWKF